MNAMLRGHPSRWQRGKDAEGVVCRWGPSPPPTTRGVSEGQGRQADPMRVRVMKKTVAPENRRPYHAISTRQLNGTMASLETW